MTCGGEHLGGRHLALVSRLGDQTNIAGNLLIAGRSLLNVAGNLSGGRALFFNRSRDRG